MTNINKLIDNEARKEQWIDPCSTSSERQVAHSAFINGANFILNQNRWRKVEEELPEWKGEVFTLITKKNSEYGCIYNIFPIYSEKSILFMNDLADEWKPIL